MLFFSVDRFNCLQISQQNVLLLFFSTLLVIKQEVSPNPLVRLRPLFQFGNMAAARKHKRVAASQPGFLPIKSGLDDDGIANLGRRKRVNKNKKKNWNKHSDIQDVEEFLEDVRLQQRATG